MKRSIVFLILMWAAPFGISQDALQESPSPRIELTVDEGRVLLHQLTELEFRRLEVTALLKQIEEVTAKNAALITELRTQIDLEKEAHEYTRKELKATADREAFYKQVYEDLKKPPPSKGMSRAVKWGIVGAVVVAGAVIGYAVSR